MTIMINGQLSTRIKADDRGLAYGDGLFETIEVSRGRLVYWQRHMDRLTDGCKRLFIPAPDQAQLLDEARQLLKPESDGVLKIMITRGSGGRGYRFPEAPVPTRLLSIHPKPDYPVEQKNRGVSLGICTTKLGINPLLAGLKHLNRLEQVMARSELNSSRYQEGLMLDYEGYPIEGIMTNLFWLSAGELFTPDLGLCGVSGVIRSIIIELAEKNGIPYSVDRFTMDQLLAADEIFVTNSLIGIWPVKNLDSQQFLPGLMTKKIMELLNNEREKDLEYKK